MFRECIGILVMAFRIFSKPNNLPPDVAKSVLTSIVLHNMPRTKYSSHIDATNSLAEECMEKTFLVTLQPQTAVNKPKVCIGSSKKHFLSLVRFLGN